MPFYIKCFIWNFFHPALYTAYSILLIPNKWLHNLKNFCIILIELFLAGTSLQWPVKNTISWYPTPCQCFFWFPGDFNFISTFYQSFLYINWIWFKTKLFLNIISHQKLFWKSIGSYLIPLFFLIFNGFLIFYLHFDDKVYLILYQCIFNDSQGIK